MLPYIATAAAAALALAPVVAADVIDVKTAANNSLFFKWRPTYHFAAPSGWMNDPVAPYYDENTGLYHLFYQHHAQHVQWGNISNSHAVSRDMMVWYDVPNPLVATNNPLIPSAIVTSWVNRNNPDPTTRYDRYGVFSGGAFPNDPLDFKKGFSVVYTSVQELPTGWSIAYKPNTETVSLVETTDGVSWQKYSGNPVIPSPSGIWNVTGWRDPLPILESESFREALFPNDPVGTAYAVMAGGFKAPYPKPGPRLYLYRTLPSDKHLTKWEYAGNFFFSEINKSWSRKWSGSFGSGFEMSGAFLLVDDDGDDHWCVSSSSQGDRTDPDAAKGSNWVWWGCGDVSADGVTKDTLTDSSYLKPNMVGVPDFGEAYAFNTFLAPPYKKAGSGGYGGSGSGKGCDNSKGGYYGGGDAHGDDEDDDDDGEGQGPNGMRRILLAWSFEGLTFSPKALGYQGAHVIPREAYIWSADVLDGADRATEQGSWTAIKNADGSYRIKTLALKPVAETALLRANASRHIDLLSLTANLSPSSGYTRLATMNSAAAYQISFTLTPPSSSATAASYAPALVFRRSPTSGEQTSLSYNPDLEAVTVTRAKSSLSPDFSNSTDTAPLRLWTLKKTGARQKIAVDLYVDNSLVEVFVNGVLALTSRIYPTADDAHEVGVAFNADPAKNPEPVKFERLEAWDFAGGVVAFPARPVNTSLPLVWDGPEVAGLWDGF
ncbi:glycosyl hydrolase [Zopfochytrium polystomum]|nr:glycosyl hydrolase [Zopfochytrium polystomum]